MSRTPVDLLTAMIRNACVNDGTPDSGGEERSVATLSAYLGEDGEVVEPHPGRTSTVYRLGGRDAAAPRLLLLGHTDVVPANPDTWRRDPFGGEVVDGVVWGRGAVDMLNQTAAMAEVYRSARDGEIPIPPGGLTFAAVADEEAGGRLGAEHLVTHHPDLVACDYLITEIAMPAIPTPSGPVLPVTVAEKGPAWKRFHRTGTPGHGSQPYATDNALVPVARAVARLDAAAAPVTISQEWRAFVAGLGLDAARARALVDPDLVDDAIEDLALEDPGFARWVHACTHLTVTPTVLRAGIKSNVVPDTADADVDVRLVPGQDQESVDDHFRKAIGPDLLDDLEVVSLMDFPPTGSPPEGPLWEAIAAAAGDVLGSRRLVPALIPVTTDARFFRARGVIAYGVGAFDPAARFGDHLAMFHGNDERVSVESLRLTTGHLAATVARFAASTVS
jgi:acetylornithine deacetylase/succinyl-diaminopimelate desuccinylase-like protein